MHLSSTIISTIFIAAIAVVGVLVFKDDGSAPSILFAVSLALLTSSVFYAVTVVAPDLSRRRRVRRGLSKQYQSFKSRCIDLFLIASRSQEYQNRENLLNHKEFRRYFSIRDENGQSRWNLVATSIDNQDYIFNEIVREFDFLDREIEFARLSVEINDEAVEQFFINLRQVIHTIKAAEENTDDYKHFCRTLWGVFARWNFVDGQIEEDIIESMISGI